MFVNLAQLDMTLYMQWLGFDYKCFEIVSEVEMEIKQFYQFIHETHHRLSPFQQKLNEESN